ncbi:hypothetical protein LCGC14_1961550 [marine sediment metagenome]|uniref:Uncharacterized protein n=1 Tax=marine sediment metagenome TaxID=412755 RepID=A0A0F9HSW2_9ZZZZ
MAYKEMTLIDIREHIDDGKLVVYLDEEYGYRQWFWFPNMPESELQAYWDSLNAPDFYFSIYKLLGDMVPCESDFPMYDVWDEGFRLENSWRAHLHWDDDSWLKGPGDKYGKKEKV